MSSRMSFITLTNLFVLSCQAPTGFSTASGTRHLASTALSATLSSSAADRLAQVEPEPVDSFVETTYGLTGIPLSTEQIGPIAGYVVPPSDKQEENHYDDRPQGDSTPIDTLVMHYTVADYRRTLGLFTTGRPCSISKPTGRVSAHFVITEEEQALGIPGGQVIRVAPDHKRAWHAGVSYWGGASNLNGRSIGIENVNRGYDGAPGLPERWYPFDPSQIARLGELSRHLIDTHGILPINVVGHADIAPDRKQDPGILFPWGRLHDEFGVGAWLNDSEMDPESINRMYAPTEPLPKEPHLGFFTQCLQRYGYKVDPTDYATPASSDVIKAFKAHFSQNQDPQGFTDELEQRDMFWIWALNAKYHDLLKTRPIYTTASI